MQGIADFFNLSVVAGVTLNVSFFLVTAFVTVVLSGNISLVASLFKHDFANFKVRPCLVLMAS